MPAIFVEGNYITKFVVFTTFVWNRDRKELSSNTSNIDCPTSVLSGIIVWTKYNIIYSCEIKNIIPLVLLTCKMFPSVINDPFDGVVQLYNGVGNPSVISHLSSRVLWMLLPLKFFGAIEQPLWHVTIDMPHMICHMWYPYVVICGLKLSFFGWLESENFPKHLMVLYILFLLVGIF